MSNHITTDLLVDYVHHELAPEEDALVHAHLGECAGCRREVENESALTDALRSAAAAEETDMPSLVAARVWETIRSARPSPLGRLAVLLRPAVAVPLAAALVIGAYVAVPLSHGGPAPTIDAGYYLEQHAAAQVQYPLAERGATLQPADRAALEDDSPPAQLAEQSNVGVATVDFISAVR